MTVHDQCLQHPVSTVSEPSAFLSLVKVTFSLVLRLKYAKKGLLARFNCMLCTYNLFGGQGNSKRRCRYMHFNKSSLVPHPEETIVC